MVHFMVLFVGEQSGRTFFYFESRKGVHRSVSAGKKHGAFYKNALGFNFHFRSDVNFIKKENDRFLNPTMNSVNQTL